MNHNLTSLTRIATKPKRLIVGLMSGTSLDGLDVALCEVAGHGPHTRVNLKRFTTVQYSKKVKLAIREVFAKKEIDFEQLCTLNPWIADLHASMVLICLKKWNVSPKRIDLLASHGQTVFHAPRAIRDGKMINSTLQLGDGDHLAVRTGILTVSDFRQKHVAVGGEGAPLAAYGDFLLFSHKTENRILLNIGGISNFTYLPAGKNPTNVIVTDTGPGNTLMDQMVRKNFPERGFDKDAAISRKGRVNADFLSALKSDPFFRRPFPKTTGPELFNVDWVMNALVKSKTPDLSLEDKLATLTRLTAETSTDAIRKVMKGKEFKLYVSGGGAHNPLLMQWITELLGLTRIYTTDSLGIPGDAKEAILFAVLANQTIAGDPVTIGVEIPAVSLGKISFPQ